MPAVWLFLLLAIAGCAENSAPAVPADPDGLAELQDQDISGVVVDQAIVPIEGAQVIVLGWKMSAVTDASGRFSFDGLEPGSYTVEAGHAFYDTVQTLMMLDGQSNEVVKLQLTRVVFDEPYTSQVQVYGYLVCSSNFAGVIAEECGEGAGVPCEAPVIGPIPLVGCQRIGGTAENQPEAQFFVDGPNVKTIQAEIVWDSTFTIGSGVQQGGFTAIMATWFGCDPICRYENSLDDKVGSSPLIMRTDDGDQGGSYFTAPDVHLADAGITTEVPVSVFVWTSDGDLAAATFDQAFTVYVTSAYVLPLPEDWTLVEDGEPPF